ncbi:hypothetical protein DY000_02048985 [Brassica cretica]|uniref:Uncharacterized protein n=1 Tax=Brassica cretica TaxID=69181 RepID=A0ABQ7ER84_BRACR|nr:hypothetical protein DY000_02048985 [Brassica cretica]
MAWRGVLLSLLLHAVYSRSLWWRWAHKNGYGSGSGEGGVDSGAAGGYGSVVKVIQLETEVAAYT